MVGRKSCEVTSEGYIVGKLHWEVGRKPYEVRSGGYIWQVGRKPYGWEKFL